jgi:uncharacterized membrane protein YgdD (TMEM256/DUF423 family)
VGLGAFGAHGLKAHLAQIPDGNHWWNTATFYLLSHAVAVASQSGEANLSVRLWAGGATIFSSTLYAMALGGPRWLGAITPIGGAAMLSGWIALCFSHDDKSKSK